MFDKNWSDLQSKANGFVNAKELKICFPYGHSIQDRNCSGHENEKHSLLFAHLYIRRCIYIRRHCPHFKYENLTTSHHLYHF